MLAQCEQFLRQHLNADNALHILGQAEMLGMTALQQVRNHGAAARFITSNLPNAHLATPSNPAQACTRVVKRKFAAVSASDTFLELSGDQLLSLLQSHETSVPCESVALAAALRWLQHDPEGRQELADSLVKAVRVSYLPAPSLAAAANHPVLERAPAARQRLLSASHDEG